MAKNSLANFYKQPANFMYIFATDKFINKLGRSAAFIIRTKKANQKKLLNTTAVDEGVKYEAAYKSMSAAFKDMYKQTPKKALVTLAEGGEVAGKNWKEGVYGIGKTVTEADRYYYSPSGAKSDVQIENNGYFYDNKNNTFVDTQVVSYGKDGKPNCVKYVDEDGFTYTASCTKKGQWYASGMSYKDKTWNSKGKEINASDMGNVWESLALSFDKIVQWLLSLFNSANNTDKQAISAANTQPNQRDGWISNAGISPLILVAVGAGVLFASGGLNNFWKNAGKGKRK